MRYVNDRNTKALGAELLPVLDRIDAYPPALSAEQSPPPAAPVYLLHGTDDTVIPAVETRLLAQSLRARGTPVHPLLSGLITHAEVDKSAAAGEILDAGSLLGGITRRVKCARLDAADVMQPQILINARRLRQILFAGVFAHWGRRPARCNAAW